jgi:biotin carboxyl carrier protein
MSSPALPQKQQAEVPVPAPTVPAHTADCTPPASQASSEDKEVAAPIPGVIISIAVKPGDQVTHGQELCVLEAMKMKNAIRSTRAGTIDTVQVAKGDSVSHGQVLMVFKG